MKLTGNHSFSFMTLVVLFAGLSIAGCNSSKSSNTVTPSTSPVTSATPTPTPSPSSSSVVTPSPSASSLPSPNWTAYDWTGDETSGNVTMPNGWIEGNGSYPMTNYCSVTNGILTFDTTSLAAATPSYKINITGAEAVVGFKMTVVFRAKANGPSGWDLDFRSLYREIVRISNSSVYLAAGSNGLYSSGIDPTSWHTYFVTFEIVTGGITTKVYVDGATTPAVERTSTVSDSSGYLRIGEGSSGSAYQGSMDWIFYTKDDAYTPGSVTLPNGYSL